MSSEKTVKSKNKQKMAYFIKILRFGLPFFILIFAFSVKYLYAAYSYLQLDEVRMYDRVLSQTEIQKLYQMGKATINESPTNRLTQGLVGYWTFDGKDTNWTSETAGTVTDRSPVGTNTGTLTNMSRSSSPVIGKLGQALKFDGSNNYVNIPSSSSNSLGQEMTMAFWFKGRWASNKYFMGKLGGFLEQTYIIGTGFSSNDLVFYRESNNTAFDATLTSSTFYDGEWTFVAGVSTGGDLKIYVGKNGTITSDSGGLNQTWDTGGTPALAIGSATGGTEKIAATVDEVRIYNRALSADEVKQLYNMGR